MISFKFSVRHFVMLVGLSLAVSNCAWLNSPTTKDKPTAQAPKNPTDPNLPYFVVSFYRQDGQPLEAFKVIQISPASTTNSVWALDDHNLAIRKLNDGEKIFFAIDFGTDFEVAQLSVEKGNSCTSPTGIFLITSFTLASSSGCGPNDSLVNTVTVWGTPTNIVGQL